MADGIKFVQALPIKNSLHEAIYRINVGLNLPRRLAHDAIVYALTTDNPELRAIYLGILLNSLMAKGPTIEELIGTLSGFLSLDGIDPTQLSELSLNKPVIGLAGSGKKGIKTFNISSTAAIVAAAMGGAYVAKDCSASTSSLTGSADFIEKLGANLDQTPERMIEIMKETGIGFFKIENRLPKVDKLYNGRFYAPHALSFALPALTLPFKPNALLYGLAHPNVELSARTLNAFGFVDAMVVSSSDDGVHFLDEMGIFGTTNIIGCRSGILGDLVHVDMCRILGLCSYTRADIAPAESVEDNLGISVSVLKGQGTQAQRDIVAVNAATILFLAKKVTALEEGYRVVSEFIETGGAYETLKRFVNATGGKLTI